MVAGGGQDRGDAGVGGGDLGVEVGQQRHVGGQHVARDDGLSGRQRLPRSVDQALRDGNRHADVAAGGERPEPGDTQPREPRGVGELGDHQATDLGIAHAGQSRCWDGARGCSENRPSLISVVVVVERLEPSTTTSRSP